MNMKTVRIIISLVLIGIFPLTSMASIEVVGSLRHVHKGNKGDVYKGEIKINNSGDTDQEVRIYQTDLLYNYEDYTFYDDPVTHSR